MKIDPPVGGGAVSFLGEVYLVWDRVADEAVQALALAGGEVLDDLTLVLFDDHVDAVVALFVIPAVDSFWVSEYFMVITSGDILGNL